MLSKEHKIYKTSNDTKQRNSLFQERRDSKNIKPNAFKKTEKDCLNRSLQPVPPLFSINMKDFSTTLDALLENFSIKTVLIILFSISFIWLEYIYLLKNDF